MGRAGPQACQARCVASHISHMDSAFSAYADENQTNLQAIPGETNLLARP